MNEILKEKIQEICSQKHPIKASFKCKRIDTPDKTGVSIEWKITYMRHIMAMDQVNLTTTRNSNSEKGIERAENQNAFIFLNAYRKISKEENLNRFKAFFSKEKSQEEKKLFEIYGIY